MAFTPTTMLGDQGNEQANDGPNGQLNSKDHRSSQYEFAEYRQNPLPELAVDSNCLPEAVVASPGQGGLDCDDESTRTIHPVVQPDFNDPRGPAVVYAEPDRSWIAKHKTWVIAGLIMAVIILTGVTVGVVITERSHNNSSDGGAVR